MRHTYSGISDGHAECEDCDWRSSSYKNALATAARHADAYGHTVSAEQVVNVTYANDAEHQRRQARSSASS
jgi:hypothetical protein